MRSAYGFKIPEIDPELTRVVTVNPPPAGAAGMVYPCARTGRSHIPA